MAATTFQTITVTHRPTVRTWLGDRMPHHRVDAVDHYLRSGGYPRI